VRTSTPSLASFGSRPIVSGHWRDEFVLAGQEGLKARPTEPADRKLREAERQIGRLTMELEVWQAAGRRSGLQIPPRRRPR